MDLKRGDIFWTKLNPTKGAEIYGKGRDGARPCVVLSPDVLNKNLDTVIVAPITSTITGLPCRVKIQLINDSEIMLDQLRALAKSKDRFGEFIRSLTKEELVNCLDILTRIFSLKK